MRPVEISKEQKVKLLEMCEYLFPEYSFFLGMFTNCTVSLGLKTSRKYEAHIPWFEFLYVHLVPALSMLIPFREQPEYVKNVYSGWKKGDRWTLYTEFLFSYPKNKSVHPIDFLYQEFKDYEKQFSNEND